MSPVANRSVEQSQRPGDSAAASATGNALSQATAKRRQTKTRAKRQPLTYAAVGTPENLQQQYRQQATEAAMKSIHLPHLDDMMAQLSSWDHTGDKRIFESVSRFDLRDTAAKLSQQGSTIMVLQHDISQLEDQKHTWQQEQKEMISDLSLSEEEVQRQKEMLSDRDSHILSLKQKLSSMELKLADSNNENGQLKQQLSSTSTGSKDDKIQELQQVVQQLRQELDQKNTAATSSRSESAQAESLTLAELHKRNLRLKAAINTYMATSVASNTALHALVNGGELDVET